MITNPVAQRLGLFISRLVDVAPAKYLHLESFVTARLRMKNEPNTAKGPLHVREHVGSSRQSVKRTLYISGLALINAVLVGFIAKILILLISFFTNIFFYGEFSLEEVSPANHGLGYWGVAIPIAGGLIVGIMARFGSEAIRGHGIPEAMEKIIRGESKIHPLITILKPLSSAISIGTGGPFGAEGPIISTGGALGSFCGQTLHITSQERKVLLAAGATAGMTAVFGTPFAAILLAIELLLFEFSARSFIPVMIACVTGACMHFLLFGVEPVFPLPDVGLVSSSSVIAYGIIGIIIGFFAVFVTKTVYLIEDAFEKIPVHWMWWPAIGGIGVGVIGIFAPYTLGVGYENISNALSGELATTILLSLCFWKFASWAIALGSGTSGGTLAPLLTMGSAAGCLLGLLGQRYFPDAGINISLAGLVGMAALFAGSARALLTSIVFAMETTMQEQTLLPLIAGCVTAYLVSFIMMRTTIMTEKIQRRGVQLPENYLPDVLEMNTVGDVLKRGQARVHIIGEWATIGSLKSWFAGEGFYSHDPVLVTSHDNKLKGTVTKKILFETAQDDNEPVSAIMNARVYSIYEENSLQLAVEFMIKTNQNVLPVIDRNTHQLLGVIAERDVLKAFEQRFHEEKHIHRHISMKEATLSVFRKSKDLVTRKRSN